MKRIIAKVIGYAIWILISLLCLSLFRSISRANQIKIQIQAEKDKISKIQAENNRLQEELIRAQSPEFIEKEVRNKLGLGKSGEAIVVLPNKNVVIGLAPQKPIDIETLPDPNWKKWMKLFF